MSTYIKYDSHSLLTFHKAFSESCNVDIHIHDTYEIYQALTDNIRYFVEGSAYDLNKGDIIISSNSEIHRPMTVNHKLYGRRFVQFNPSLIQTFIDIDYNPLHIFEDRQLGQHNHLILPPQAESIVDTYFKTIESALINKEPRRLYECRMTLVKFLIELETLYEASVSIEDLPLLTDPRIYKIRQYLDLHFTEPFCLDELSKRHLIDKYHLSRLFKENTGFTLLEYIQSKRIKYAKTLLVSNRSILSISQQCGYGDYTNFFKTFKKLTKLSPKQYRATLLG